MLKLKFRNGLLRQNLCLQNTSQDLPTRRLGNNIQDSYTSLQPFMPRLMLLYIPAHSACDLLIRNALCFVAFHDKRQWDFACALVHDADHCAVGDVWVVEKMGLQLCGSDLMALDG